MRSLTLACLAVLVGACADPGGELGDDDLGPLVGGKGDLVDIERSVTLRRRSAPDSPSTRTFTVTSDVDFEVTVTYEGADEVEIVVGGETGPAQTSGKAHQPRLRIDAADGEATYRVRLRNWSARPVTVLLRIRAVQDGALPETIDLGGDTSSVAVGDVDDDGRPDLAALVGLSDGQVELVIAFGDAGAEWRQRHRHALVGTVRRESRDSSSSVVALADVDADGRLDAVTAAGAALGRAARAFAWQSFGDEADNAYQPVAVVLGGSTPRILRGTRAGVVQECGLDGSCRPLPGQPAPCGPEIGCAVQDLVVGDIDADGASDVLAGGPSADGTDAARLWTLSDGPSQPIALGLACVDLEVGDVDDDGDDDVVAQQVEAISDFPTYTDVLWATPDAAAPFGVAQTLYNSDNHTDNMALVDADGDGCLDLLQIGVDHEQIAVRYGAVQGSGCTGILGPHDVDAEVDVGWTTRPGLPFTIGIQQADVDGDGVQEWILRAPAPSEDGASPRTARLHLRAIPLR